MSRLKKSKFRMDIYIGDGMLELSIYISEQEFKDFLSDLKEQHSKHNDTNQEFYTEYHTKVKEYLMKRIITVKEFADSFLEPLQPVRITDFESEHVYFTGRAEQIQNTDSIVYSARLQCVQQYHGLTEPDGIELFI